MPNNLNSIKMKKIFTLLTASLLTMAVFAADHRPSVTVKASRNYEIVIDGRSYFKSDYGVLNISGLRGGYHSITVYDANRGYFFRKFKRVVAQSSFMLRGNDISIFIDQFGRMLVKEKRDYRGNDNRGWGNNDRDDNDRDYDNDRNRGNDRNWDNDRNQGNDRNRGNDRNQGDGQHRQF